METDPSYIEILQITQRRVAGNAKRAFFINTGLIISITAMLVAIFAASKSYRELEKAKKEIDLKNNSLVIAKLLADSLRYAAQRSKFLNDSMSKHYDSLILQDPKLATAILNTANTKTDSAKLLNERGYELLKLKMFSQALQSFQDSENTYNGFKDSYELAYLLRKNKDKFNDPKGQKYLLQIIFNEYNHLNKITKDDYK